MSEEARILSMFMQGRSFDEIALSMGLDRDRVENVVKSILSKQPEDEQDVGFAGFENELVSLFKIQKRRVMRYVSLENNMRIPIPETKDNMVILVKILEVLWRIKGDKVSVSKMKEDLFSLE